jgi:hypothetical protein
MAEWDDTYEIAPQPEMSSNWAAPWLAFLVGALLLAFVAVFLFNSHGKIGVPAGHAFTTISSATAPAVPLPHI